jgi:predicted porin
LAALAATGVVSAQSSVSISGVLDVGVRNVSKVAPGAAETNVGSGNNNRIAFSVTEDLGGGLRAIANAQMRFDPATGLTESSGARPLFQGETRVGVAGGFGTVMFGRGLTALQAPNGGNSDPWGVTTVAGSVYAAGFATDYAAGGEGRIDQGIFYTSPSISGLTLGASFSPRKLGAPAVAAVAATAATADKVETLGSNAVPAITSAKTHYSLNALYSAGPLVVGAGQEQNRVGDKITMVYGNYDLGVAKVFASSAQIKGGSAADRAGITFAAAASAVNSGAMGTAAAGVAPGGKIENHSVGAIIPMGATSFRLGYSVWDGSGSVGQKKDNKLGLGVRYTLSKRTYVYSDMASQTRKNNTGTRPDRDKTKVRSFDLGVAHSF